MRLHYRYYPKVVERALGAAEKIRRSGLPPRAYGAVPDTLLRAILVGAAEEEDPVHAGALGEPVGECSNGRVDRREEGLSGRARSAQAGRSCAA